MGGDHKLRLRGVTIGCGFFSRIQMESWSRVEGAEITAACDLDRAKAEAFAADFGLKPYVDLNEMIDAEKPDFVDIATRPATHVPLCRAIAAKGIPILCQKPMAETWDEACELAAVGRESGVRLMINENWRWQGWYREIKRRLDAGAVGRPFYYSMQTRNRDGLGDHPFPNQPYFAEMPRLLLFEALVHHIDAARFLYGDIVEVYCRTARLNPKIRAEDFALIMLEHEGGVRGVIDGNRASPPDEAGPAMEVGRFEGFDATLRLLHSGDVLLGGERVFEGSRLPPYRGDSCRATQQHFVDSLASGDEFESEVSDYLRGTFAVVEACYLSAEENRPIRVEEITAPAG